MSRRHPGRGKPWKQPKPVAGGVDAVLTRLELRPRLVELQVCDAWAEAVGDSFARRSVATRLARGVLQVVVENAAWLGEIRFSEKEIVARVNEGYVRRSQATGPASKPVKALHPVLGVVPARAPAPIPAPRERIVSEEEKREVEAKLASLSDPEIREAARGLLLNARAKRRGRT